jgi:putative lipoprotein
LGRDKALHFGASALISGTGYGVGTLLFERSRVEPALFGGGIALAVGAAKEGADALGLGDPSWKDFTWDVIGTVVGLAIALGIDVALRPHLQPRPAQ